MFFFKAKIILFTWTHIFMFDSRVLWLPSTIPESFINSCTPRRSNIVYSREQRTWELCTDTVEDEYHVFLCPKYTEIRQTFNVTVNTNEEIIEFLQQELHSTQLFLKQIVAKTDKQWWSLIYKQLMQWITPN